MKLAVAKMALKTDFENLKKEAQKEKYFLLFAFLLLISFLVCLFVSEAVYAVFAIVVLISILFDFEKSLSTLLFCYSFYAVFFVGEKSDIFLYKYIYAFVLLICFAKYFIDVYKGKKEIQKSYFVPLFVFLFYTVLPFFDINILNTFDFVFFVILFYLLTIYKKDINAGHLIFYAAIGFVFSCIFSYLPLRENLQTLVSPVMSCGVIKFKGLFTNPNMLSGVGLLLLPLIACNFLKKNGLFWIVLFVPVFYFCEITLFRTFLLSFAAVMLCLFVYACIKKDKEFWIKYLALCLVIGLILLCFMDYSRAWVDRILNLKHQFDEPEIDKWVVNGSYVPDESSYWWIDGTPKDPGRLALWKRYFADIFSSPQNFIFGVGISEKYLGAMPHNGFILYLWTFGLLGVIIGLYAFLPVLLKLFKNFKDEATVSYVLCMGIFMFLENIFFGVTSAYMIILFFAISKGELSNEKPVQSLSKIKEDFLFKRKKKEICFED